MARKAWIERDKRKAKTVEKYAALRRELKEKARLGDGDARRQLMELPRNACPARKVNRCLMTGRRRAYMGKFKLSRISFRELASEGKIPGVTKASW